MTPSGGHVQAPSSRLPVPVSGCGSDFGDRQLATGNWKFYALDLGPWEQIFYAEFDGRRKKRVVVKAMGLI